MKTKTQAPTRRPDGTVKSLAEGLGISRRAATDALSKGMPLELEAAKKWREERAHGDDSVVELRRQRIALVREQKEKARIENAVRRGELVEIGRVFADAVSVATGTKNALMGLLQDLPPTLEGLSAAQILPILRTRFIDVLQRLSDGEFFTESAK